MKPDTITRELEKRIGFRIDGRKSVDPKRHHQICLQYDIFRGKEFYRGAGRSEVAMWRLLRRLMRECKELREALSEMATQHKCGCGHPHCNNCERDRMCAEALERQPCAKTKP